MSEARRTYTVHAHWDAASETWWTDGEDVPGLTTCRAATFNELVKIILDRAPKLFIAVVAAKSAP